MYGDTPVLPVTRWQLGKATGPPAGAFQGSALGSVWKIEPSQHSEKRPGTQGKMS